MRDGWNSPLALEITLEPPNPRMGMWTMQKQTEKVLKKGVRKPSPPLAILPPIGQIWHCSLDLTLRKILFSFPLFPLFHFPFPLTIRSTEKTSTYTLLRTVPRVTQWTRWREYRRKRCESRFVGGRFRAWEGGQQVALCFFFCFFPLAIPRSREVSMAKAGLLVASC